MQMQIFYRWQGLMAPITFKCWTRPIPNQLCFLFKTYIWRLDSLCRNIM